MSDFNIKNIISVSTMNNMLVKDLRNICANLEIPKYSKANKTILIEMLTTYYKNKLNDMTVENLRNIIENFRNTCANFNITGISKATKPNLIKIILSKTEESVEDDVELEDDVIDLSTSITTDNESSTDDIEDTITVTCGAKERVLPFVDEGKSIWDIHAELVSVMGISSKPTFTVNEMDAPNNYIIQSGDMIEFFQETRGNKGI